MREEGDDWNGEPLSPREKHQTRKIIGVVYPNLNEFQEICGQNKNIAEICKNYVGRKFLRAQLRYYALAFAAAGGALVGLRQVIEFWPTVKSVLDALLNR